MKSQKPKEDRRTKAIVKATSKLPILEDDNDSCDFYGYNVESLMKETAELRNIITKRGTLEIQIPLCCSADTVRYVTFMKSMKGSVVKLLQYA